MSGVATTTSPPQDDNLFKSIGTTVPRLGSHRHRRGSGSAGSSNETVLGQIATILTSVSGRSRRSRSRSCSHSDSHHRSSHSHSHSHAIPMSSPPKNTPTKLTRFLKYAATEGVPDATMYEHRMKMKGYGPDILGDVETSDLVEIGIPPGDVLRLKRAAPVWWSSADAKRQCTKANAFGQDDSTDLVQSLIGFEKRYKDGSGAARTAGTLEPTDDFFDETFDWFYYFDAAKKMVPIPPGFMPVIMSDI